MPRPARPPHPTAARSLLIAALLLGAACTTEFVPCQGGVECAEGEVCQTVRLADGGVVMNAGEPVEVCVRPCVRDTQCVSARNEVCLFETPEASTGVCGRGCVSSADCNLGQTCSFDRCVPQALLPDAAPPPDGAPSDLAVGPDGSPADGTMPDGAASDARAPDATLADGAADMAPADMAPADMSPPDVAPADMSAPDLAPVDMSPPDMAVDMAPGR